ncbi:MAG: L,D-transpeptidase family protein [Bacteroidales bacterium]|jgi:murein L,D-transpeptidase YcbB/YkuD|nr:L,D-transpeptidase family protein [Bacteroidales bacterium]
MKKWEIVSFILLGLAACQTPQQEETAPTIEYIKRPKIKNTADIPVFDYDWLTSEIETYFLYFSSDSDLNQLDLVRDYYALHAYQPHWIDISDTLQQAEYLSILASAETHGLDRNTYHYDRLATNLENLSFFYFETGKINYQLWAESEILLSDGLILFTEHLKRGVFDPLSNEDYHYFISSKDTIFFPFGVFYAENLWSFFQNLTPSNVQYKTLQNEYLKRLKKPESTRANRDIDTLNILRVNLERWRWHPLFTESDQNVVYVNIPAFELYVLKADSVLMSSKVCVGIKRPKTYATHYRNYLKNPEKTPKPRHNETPILKDKITYLTLNPQWRVPSEIAKNEILRNIQKDSNYLSRMGYHVYRGNVLIDPHSVNWNAITPANLTYRFEQSAGELNALGKMKFMFPNKFSVYLHDTPSKNDFLRRNRAVSHGCVRVENYLELAHTLLSNIPKYNIDYLRKTIGLDEENIRQLKTVNVFLNPPISVIIDYKTAWIDTDGNLHIYSDVYERDLLVLEALQK